jgi:hypothetical protein
MKFEFDPDSHIYTAMGREVPGCTRVLDSGGLVNYRHVRPDILERKSKLGREVHRVTALYDRDALDFSSVDERVTPYLDSWIRFRKQTGFRAELREHQVMAEVQGMFYGMQIDAAGFTGVGGRGSIDTVVEIKCVVRVLPHHAIQLAGYALGLPRSLQGKSITSPMGRFLGRRRIVVQLTPRGIPNIHECDQMEDADTFLYALWLSEWRRRHEKIYREAA